MVVEGEDSQDLFIIRKGGLVVEKAMPDVTLRPPAHRSATLHLPSSSVKWPTSVPSGAPPRCRPVEACQALHLKPTHLDDIMAGFPKLTRILCRQFATRPKEANEELRGLKARFDLSPQRRMAQPGRSCFGPGSLRIPCSRLSWVRCGSALVKWS
jgi:hypothetical protein